MSEECKITAGTISGATLKSIDIEPSIIIEGKSYTASEFNKAVEMLKQPQLNDNQQIVFDFLKNEFKRNDLQYTLWSFTEDVYERLEIGVSSLPYVKAWGKLKEKQQFEVLAAFAQWGLEQEEAG